MNDLPSRIHRKYEPLRTVEQAEAMAERLFIYSLGIGLILCIATFVIGTWIANHI